MIIINIDKLKINWFFKGLLYFIINYLL